VPRFIIERSWDDMDEQAMDEAAARSKRIAEQRYPEIHWEHSHVVMDSEGRVKSFCVHTAPEQAVIHRHAEELGQHYVDRVFEIAGDISPSDFPT
jgi:uncharacterized protein DUF4242